MNLTNCYINILNAKYGFLFAADGDKDHHNHIVETKKDDGGDFYNSKKYIWQLQQTTNGLFHIKNQSHGYLRASKHNTKGGDHVVETDPNPSLEELKDSRFLWSIKNIGNHYLIENNRFGTMFTADGDKKGGDHIAETCNHIDKNDKEDVKFHWYIQPVNFLKKWMTALPDEKLLSEFTIPGTHETCARHGGGVAECQSMTLLDQLNRGVRFLDIRCRHSDSHFSIFHGSMYQELRFGSGVRDVCYQFLKDNPSETIIMLVKNEGGGDNPQGTFEDQFKKYISGSSQWYTGNSLPTLGDVRGKIVLLRRFVATKESLPLGFPGRHYPDGAHWADNEIFEIKTDTIHMSIQDKYKRSNSEYKSKYTDFRNLMDKAYNGYEAPLNSNENTRNVLYINYASGVGGIKIPPFPKHLSDKVNPKVLNHINNKPSKGRNGCLLLDFTDAMFTSAAIHANELHSSKMNETLELELATN